MPKPKIHPLIATLETRTGLGPIRCARLLGWPYITYAQFKSLKRELKDHQARYIELVLFLESDQLAEWIERHEQSRNNETDGTGD